MLIRNLITGSFPKVIHAPDTSKIWQDICKKFFSSSHSHVKTDNRLKILTWNNLESSPLEKCLNLRNIPFEILGKNIVTWNNLKKFSLNIDCLNSFKSKYFMGLDSHDCLLIGDPVDIVNEFEELNCDMMFNSETYFYPNIQIEYYQSNKRFQDQISDKKYKFLNSGAWIGKREFCLDFFNDCSKIRIWEMFDCTNFLKLFNCDQSVVHSIFSKYYPSVILDYDCKIFNNISMISDKEICYDVRML